MALGSFYFKQKAREALKGNWQTAMVVAFFSGILVTVSEVLMTLYMPDLYAYTLGERIFWAVEQTPRSAWIALTAVNLLSLLLTPALSLGCHHYFVERLRGTELGAAGLWSRRRSFARAIWLYVNIGVRIFLWSLLLIVPGIIAALRYGMAPYYLAEHPEMTVSQAIAKSKHTMRELKTSYFALLLSFVGWLLASNAAQVLLAPLSGVLATTVGLFIQAWVTTYTNGACAAFYLTVSSEEGVSKAQREIGARMREMGIDPSAWEEATRKRPPEREEDQEAKPEERHADDDGGDTP